MASITPVHPVGPETPPQDIASAIEKSRFCFIEKMRGISQTDNNDNCITKPYGEKAFCRRNLPLLA
jgi:hypothetical protein